MSFVPIAIMYFDPLEAVHVCIDDDRYHAMWLNVAECDAVGPNWTSQISYDVVESLLRKLSF